MSVSEAVPIQTEKALEAARGAARDGAKRIKKI
jgi:hypothetical protein